MGQNFTRRNFIKIAGVTAGGVAVGGGMMKLVSNKLSKNEGPVKVTKSPTYCEMCTFACAGWVYKKNDKPWKIIGNENDDHSYGRLCTKGTAGLGTYNDPDRLKTPLIRTGEKGKQVFKEATWDEAFEYIAKKMDKMKKEHGPETMAMFSHGAGGTFFKTLLKGYGSNNITAPSYANCRGPREEGYLFTYGEAINSPERTDMKNSNCIVLLGSHIGENTHSAQVKEFTEAIGKGATIIVVDPRFSTAASKAKYWLPIKPGTDIALLLAWINVIITEGLYDRDYIEKYANGLDKLTKSIKKNTPEWAYPVTGIKPEIIRKTAREIAMNAPASLIHPGRHNVWYGDDTQRVRAHAILNALLGSFGKKGGFYNPVKATVPKFPIPKFPKSKKTWRDAMNGKYELANLAIASGICDASIPSVNRDWNYHGWLVYGSNLIKTLPDQAKTIKAIQALDLLVVVDILPTEITGWADVVLPECTYVERFGDLRISQGRRKQIALRSPAFEPKYNSKPAWWIAKNLAKKMDLAQYFPWKNIEEYLNYRLKKVGSSLKEMKKIGVKTLKNDEPIYIGDGEDYQFGTDSGKIELYSQTLADYGFDPIPKYTHHEEPEQNFYRLLYGRSPLHSFGRTQNNTILSQLNDENEVWVSSVIAKEWGLENGQYVKLENQDGIISNKIKVKVTERLRSDCVYMVHGFGSTQKKLRRTYNRGADDTQLMTKVKYDPIMGGNAIRSNFVTFKV